MSESAGTNPPLSTLRVEYTVQSDTVDINRLPPPPYTPTVTTQPIIQTIIIQPPLTSEPMNYTCPYCEERIVTKVEYINTRTTHMIAGFICGFTVWCLLCCLAAIPYVIPIFKEAKHYCPNCNKLLGTYCKM